MAQKLEPAEAINQTFSFVRKEFMPLLMAMNIPVVLMLATATVQWLLVDPLTQPLGRLLTPVVTMISMLGYSMAVYQRVVLGKKITAMATFRLLSRKGLRVTVFEVFRWAIVGLVLVGFYQVAKMVRWEPRGIAELYFGMFLIALVCMIVLAPFSFGSCMYGCVRNARFRLGVRMTKGYRSLMFCFWGISGIMWIVIVYALSYLARTGMRIFIADNAAGTGFLLLVVLNNLILMISTAYWSAGSALFFRNAAKRMIMDKK